MSQQNKNSGFRNGVRKTGNVILTINLIFGLIMMIGIIVFIVWLNSQT